MGNTTSKKASVIDTQKTPEKKSVAEINEKSPTKNNAQVALEPQTPAIPQTPLTQTIATHLNHLTKHNMNQNSNIKTPSYLLRKKILYDLGYTYPIKEADPRSPSQCIPRTPLNITDTVDTTDESKNSSFLYNSTLEDSCRDFNTKLDDITMEETDANDQNEAKPNTPTNGGSDETQVSLCAQKTPDCDSEDQPDFDNPAKTAVATKVEATKDEEMEKVISQEIQENIEHNESVISTPSLNKSIRTGRIPLSVVNRRAVAGESTPLNKKNISADFSIEKNRKDLSFNIHDENRSSARKSKIPVFKKSILSE